MILRIYVNDIDITSSVQMKSVKIQSSTGNRRNTASFIVNDYQINEAQEIEIFKWSTLSAGISAGVSSFTIDDSDSDLVNNISYFLRAWDKVILGYRTANEERVTIDHISWSTVYITWVTARSHSLSDMIWGKLFAGITLKNPREEIGKSEMMTFSVDATDYSTILDAQNVVDTWEGVNSREILSRIVYLFTSVDSSVTLSSCETLTGLTSSGVAVTPTLNSTDKVFQNYSINIGASGAGSWVYTWTFSAINVSAMDIARLWINTPATPSSYISAMTYRIVDGSGNSYTWTANVWSGGWGYDSGRFSDAVVSWAINLSAIVKFEILFTALQAIPIGTFKIDHILATKGGFTLKNTDPGNVIFADVRSQYKKPTVLIEDIAKANGFFWYVDADKDIHFFSAEDRTAPETLTDVSTNFNKLKITADITNLRNRQTIRGGMAPEETLYPQEKVLDGKETSYRLDYPPKDLKVYLDTGAGYVLKTVGIENIVDETTVDFVMNFSEKTVRNGSIATQVAGTKIKLEYYPYKDIRVQRRDQVSIDNMKLLLGWDGIFDGPVINDESIRTFDDARARAKAELTAYSNPVLTATFDTERDGLEVWQIINISSTKYGTASGFVIQKITANQKDNEWGFTYSITCGSTLYGLTEFFQYILKKASKGEIDVNELVDVVTTVDETLVMGDVLTTRKLSAAGPWYIHSRTWQYSYTLTLTEGGTPRDAYMDFFIVA